jgi:hypothetical protein
VTTPTIWPSVSSSGPPLLPGCTAALICKNLVSFLRPPSELTMPVVTVKSQVSMP